MSSLAIHGGAPVIAQDLPPYRSMGAPEMEAVRRVMEADNLSGFYGSWGPEFHGGPVVREFEEKWATLFDTTHAVSVNSATSGLVAALGALGIGPGDEVIVPPTTMSATVMAPLAYGAIPVFVDIEETTFCLNPDLVEAAITPRTRAIIVVDLFGHPGALQRLRAIADAHDLPLVEDCAQAPTAKEGAKFAGTVGDIGVYSLNYHKHIHTGEGGVCVTDDPDLAARMQLIRNHGENAVEETGLRGAPNMIGFNWRLTELQAAIGLAQLDRLDHHIGLRQSAAEQLSAAARGLEGIEPPAVRDDCTHVYYTWTCKLDADKLGVGRDEFARALAAEGFPNATGYIRPLYSLPVFQDRTGFGREGWPFTLTDMDYSNVHCPVAERMHRDEFMLMEPCAYDLTGDAVPLLIEALTKVHEGRAELLA